MSESVKLEATCDRCGLHLELVEGSECHLIGCVACDADAGEGSTPADALESWFEKHPPPPISLSDLAGYVVPKQRPWLIESDGYPFNSLAEAADYADTHGSAIYCRLSRNQKAANQ
jgi:hypothetical protein